MLINKNYTVFDSFNDVKLQIIDLGHAITAEEWYGNIILPMYSRIYYILGGDPYVVADGKKIPLEVGKCYLFPTGYSFRHACESSMEQIYFHVNLNDFNGSDLLRCCRGMMEYKLPDHVIPTIKKYLYSECLNDHLQLKQEILNSLLTMFAKYDIKLAATRYSRCVILAIEYIRSHLSLQLDIEELAANSFVSESTLAKKFKTEVGTTIGSYIDDSIMFEAEQLLLKSDLTVLQISERFGFCDQFYFSRRFKLKYGETPQKYRKMKLI